MVVDILINSALYIILVIIPLGVLLFIFKAIFSRISRRKRARIVRERLKEIRE